MGKSAKFYKRPTRKEKMGLSSNTFIKPTVNKFNKINEESKKTPKHESMSKSDQMLPLIDNETQEQKQRRLEEEEEDNEQSSQKKKRKNLKSKTFKNLTKSQDSMDYIDLFDKPDCRRKTAPQK